MKDWVGWLLLMGGLTVVAHAFAQDNWRFAVVGWTVFLFAKWLLAPWGDRR